VITGHIYFRVDVSVPFELRELRSDELPGRSLLRDAQQNLIPIKTTLKKMGLATNVRLVVQPLATVCQSSSLSFQLWTQRLLNPQDPSQVDILIP
jgi:hypothetical protein